MQNEGVSAESSSVLDFFSLRLYPEAAARVILEYRRGTHNYSFAGHLQKEKSSSPS